MSSLFWRISDVHLFNYTLPLNVGDTTINYHCNEVDTGAEALPSECSVHEATHPLEMAPQKANIEFCSLMFISICAFSSFNNGGLRNISLFKFKYIKSLSYWLKASQFT